MRILGISCFYHDSAIALVDDGKVIFAVQEERFSRVKHDPSFPTLSIEYLIKNIASAEQIDSVVFFEKPLLKFERILETFIRFSPRGFGVFAKAMPIWIREKLFQKDLLTKSLTSIDEQFSKKEILFSEHHLSHAASAFFPSPFEDAAILTLDGVGEWATTSVAVGQHNKIEVVKEINFPSSLGMLYSAFTYYCGFRVNSGEYKLMGLAPYGRPLFKNKILEYLVDLKDDGSFRLDMEYFGYTTDLKMINEKFEDLFGFPTRAPDDEPLEQHHMDLARSIQEVIEEIVLKIVATMREEIGSKNLCLAGGVALNCVANGKIVRKGIYENVYVQPAAGDAGGALGAALLAWHQHFDEERVIPDEMDGMAGSYLGPSYDDRDTRVSLEKCGAKFSEHSYEEKIDKASDFLVQGKSVGWFHGKMEFGPRALGGRSILADPRSQTMQKDLNLKVKFRESFRPFAPSVLAEFVDKWFDFEQASPYMLFVADVKEDKLVEVAEEGSGLFGIDLLNQIRSLIPAVTHVDNSARIQTVHEETNKAYYDLLKAFHAKTGCPIVVNTSFNVRGEPIVCTPEDAFRCFMGTDLDVLVCGNFILEKDSQELSLAEDYQNKYKLD